MNKPLKSILKNKKIERRLDENKYKALDSDDFKVLLKYLRLWKEYTKHSKYMKH